MQDPVAGPYKTNISTPLITAKHRLRQFSRHIYHPFRRSQTSQIDTRTSLSVDTTSQWSEISPPPIHLQSPPAIMEHPSVMLDPPSSPSAASTSSWNSEEFNRIMDGVDGAGEKTARKSPRSQADSQVCAIFVHAGAGYHSTTNEHIHLSACNEYVHNLKLNMMLPLFGVIWGPQSNQSTAQPKSPCDF